MEQSLRAYLLREIGLIEIELLRYRERYNVLSLNELHHLIEIGLVSVHPAWEDYLEWQNGADSIEELRSLFLN